MARDSSGDQDEEFEAEWSNFPMVNIYPSKAESTRQPTFFTVNFGEYARFYDVAVYRDE